MLNLIQWFKNRYAKSHSILITVNIFKENIIHNYKEFSRLLEDTGICPVLKSNAYGHGLIEIGKIVDELNPPFIVVDAVYEAINLRMAGIRSKILIIGYTPAENIKSTRIKNISFTITSLEHLREVADAIRERIDIHLKIDTGMSRQGIYPEELDPALDILEQVPNINLEGICTHLTDADNPSDESITTEQIEYWNLCVLKTQGRKPAIKFLHASATAGFSFKDKLNANVYRLGIGLYGLDTGGNIDKEVKIKPALEIKSRISQIMTVKKGQGVGYGHTFVAPFEMKVATIPMGYYEGLDRRQGNNGFVKVGDSFASIIGRVSMNITTIDITNLPNVKMKTEVTIISKDKEDKNSIDNIAKICKTIPYEIAVHFPSQLRREVINN